MVGSKVDGSRDILAEVKPLRHGGIGRTLRLAQERRSRLKYNFDAFLIKLFRDNLRISRIVSIDFARS